MARPQRCRRICREPLFTEFFPDHVTEPEEVVITLDEFEVLRLVDVENRTYEQSAKQMDISRSTATEIYESARHKVAQAIVNGYRLRIQGGSYRVCDGVSDRCDKQRCEKRCRHCSKEYSADCEKTCER